VSWWFDCFYFLKDALAFFLKYQKVICVFLQKTLVNQGLTTPLLPKKLPAAGITQRSTTLFDFRLWATPVAGFPVAKVVPPSNNPFVFFCGRVSGFASLCFKRFYVLRTR
jgi:hypothetical protein